MTSGALTKKARRGRRRGSGDHGRPDRGGQVPRSQIRLPSVSAATAAQGRRRFVIMLAIFLYLFGLVMVTSAGTGTALLNDQKPWEFLQRQATYGALGFVALFMAMRFPLHVLRRLSWPLLLLSLCMLMLVFLPGLAHTANGATRWIQIGGFQLQPSEMVKLAVIIYIADHLARSQPPVHWMRDFVRSPGGIALGAAALVFAQKDLGTSVVIAGVVMTLYMLAGTRPRLLGQVIGPGMALITLGILSESYRRDRFLAFLNPWGDPHGTGYQLVQGLIAIGNGGVFGVGLGHSVQKVNFLPEAHTDMIFSVIAEELGLVGVSVVLFGFLAIAVVGTRIALKADNRFHALLAAGLTTALVAQAVINLGGVVGVLPLTGVPLPLISYGGSNLLISLTAFGLLANIATAAHGSLDSRHDDRDDDPYDLDWVDEGDVVAKQPTRRGRGRGNGGASGTSARGRRSPS